MKKWMIIATMFIFAYNFLGCTNKEPEKSVGIEPSESETDHVKEDKRGINVKEAEYPVDESVEEYKTVFRQLEVFADNIELWTDEYESLGQRVCYTVADLDQNGRWEIIISGIGGTGLYSSSRFYEINEDYDGLQECSTEFDRQAEPDLMYESLDAYIDTDENIHYIVYDIERNGMYGCYEETFELKMYEGKIITSLLATRETEILDEKTSITCYNSNNIPIMEEEYENIGEIHFEGYQKVSKALLWQDVKELGNNRDEVIRQLEEAFYIL